MHGTNKEHAKFSLCGYHFTGENFTKIFKFEIEASVGFLNHRKIFAFGNCARFPALNVKTKETIINKLLYINEKKLKKRAHSQGASVR